MEILEFHKWVTNFSHVAAIPFFHNYDPISIPLIELIRQDRFNKVKDRQVRKFELLNNRNRINQDNNLNFNNNRPTQWCNEARFDNNNHSVSDRDIEKWVINVSKTEWTPAQKAVLAKGPNYAIASNNIPNLEYVTAIESIGQKHREEDASELKADINTILRKGQPPKPNVNKQERRALSQLSKDKDRVILTVDKGVAMVVSDKKDYISKAQELLAQLSYKETPRDPTNKIKAQLITKLRRIKKERNLDEGKYKVMYPTGCVLPKFYGLPKIHKTGNPLGPIVSSRGSVTYGVAKVLSKVIKLLVGKSPII